MEKNKKLALVFAGLVLTLSGGVFALYYTGNFSSPIAWGIPSIAGLLVIFLAISISILRKKQSEQSEIMIETHEYESHAISESRDYQCYWCGYPLKQQGEFCTGCGKRLLRCTVCKLPISFGDEVGKCSLCESIGHFNHLFEWVKTKGFCPHCLQKIPTQAIIVSSDLK